MADEAVETPITSAPTDNSHIFGDWEELHGNYLLRPSISQGPPRALLHFLGGAMVGAAPQVSYRYMLERLAQEGYLVVATPYQLSFDHLSTCDAVIDRFERIAPILARQYGAIPVVGVGHSCGALLQLLITSLFPDTPRAANALLSFNNKPVSEAVPFFEEIFAPLFTTLSAKNGTFPSSTEVLALGLELANVATKGTSAMRYFLRNIHKGTVFTFLCMYVGELPSDELLNRVARTTALGPLQNLVPDNLMIPGAIRDTFSALTSPSTAALNRAGVLPYANQAVETLQQIPPLIEEVSPDSVLVRRYSVCFIIEAGKFSHISLTLWCLVVFCTGCRRSTGFCSTTRRGPRGSTSIVSSETNAHFAI